MDNTDITYLYLFHQALTPVHELGKELSKRMLPKGYTNWMSQQHVCNIKEYYEMMCASVLCLQSQAMVMASRNNTDSGTNTTQMTQRI